MQDLKNTTSNSNLMNIAHVSTHDPQLGPNQGNKNHVKSSKQK